MDISKWTTYKKWIEQEIVQTYKQITKLEL